MNEVLTAWRWDLTVVAGCAGLLLAYGAAICRSDLERGGRGERSWSRCSAWITGVVILFLALESPLDALADTYLFSAHMAQHLLLILVVPPLLLLGLSPGLVVSLLASKTATRCERVLSYPWLAWCAGVMTVWLWHLPWLYNATLANEGVHAFEHLAFLVTGCLFWWPVVALERYRLPTWPAIGYLGLGAAANTILAIVLTFAPVGLYPAYLHPVDTLGVLPLLRDDWGLTPQADQQLGGVLMWIPGGWAYLLAIVVTFLSWFGGVEGNGETWQSSRESAM